LYAKRKNSVSKTNNLFPSFIQTNKNTTLKKLKATDKYKHVQEKYLRNALDN